MNQNYNPDYIEAMMIDAAFEQPIRTPTVETTTEHQPPRAKTTVLPPPPSANETLLTFSPERYRLPDMTTFDGSPSGYRPFMSSMTYQFWVRSSMLTTDQLKIQFLGAHFTGAASVWLGELISSNSDTLNNYTSFLTAFQSYFSDPSIEIDATNQLRRLRQKSGTVAEYSAKFRQIANDTGFDQKALIDQYLRGLAPRVVDILILEDIPTTLEATVIKATRIGHRLSTRDSINSSDLPRAAFVRHYPRDPNAMDVDFLRVKVEISTFALIDSGASSTFISDQFVKNNFVPTHKTHREIRVETVSGRPLMTTPENIKFWVIDSSSGEDEFFSAEDDDEEEAISKVEGKTEDDSVSSLDFENQYEVKNKPEEEPLQKVPEEYGDLKEVFDENMANSLPPSRPYDCPIDTEEGIIELQQPEKNIFSPEFFVNAIVTPENELKAKFKRVLRGGATRLARRLSEKTNKTHVVSEGIVYLGLGIEERSWELSEDIHADRKKKEFHKKHPNLPGPNDLANTANLTLPQSHQPQTEEGTPSPEEGGNVRIP
ncbi:Retrotransposon-derived protein PEG10 [Zancudomyces culisetae]|uniref:Retrotransposon-derived protein PEG10 n=1 Tax=Zancudomyces culisetae TaxID=1213189 RepID=A0A1R1PE96_ZANCU|nr:Retrotransposon-derived protein PEG10 [Zancudomyces culisetae]|eukprot:OMH79320.1 Retrotransposon-derived protein PEG10 [Zancudomyces culisetae]